MECSNFTANTKPQCHGPALWKYQGMKPFIANYMVRPQQWNRGLLKNGLGFHRSIILKCPIPLQLVSL